MNTCKTCKHWSHSFRPTVQNPVADCDLPDTITGEKLHKEGKGMELYVQVNDDSGLQVTLMTGENFGCVNHTPKS